MLTNIQQGGTMTCPNCATATEVDWAFCRRCGTPLVTSSEDVTDSPVHIEDPDQQVTLTDLLATGQVTQQSVQPDAHKGRRERRWPVVVLSIALAVAFAAAGVLGWQLHDRTNQLHATQVTLAGTQTKLDGTTQDLHAAQTEVNTQSGQISTLTQNNASLTTQLKDTQTTLAGTRNTVQLQSHEIGYLSTCLNGVTAALNYVAYSDYVDAVSALQAVQSVCQKAQRGL